MLRTPRGLLHAKRTQNLWARITAPTHHIGEVGCAHTNLTSIGSQGTSRGNLGGEFPEDGEPMYWRHTLNMLTG